MTSNMIKIRRRKLRSSFLKIVDIDVPRSYVVLSSSDVLSKVIHINVQQIDFYGVGYSSFI